VSVLGVLTALGAEGCTLQFGGCEDDLTCLPTRPPSETEGDEPDPPEEGCPADPADGEVAEACGVWVSASLGDDAFPGTQAQPLRTLQQAIDLARHGSRRVYACGEEFAEAVELPPGTSLFGGFDCEDGWAYTGLEHRAVIAPGPGLIAVRWQKGSGSTRVGDVLVRSAGAVEPGGSSIAMLFEDFAEGSLRRSEIRAGDGADGADGEDGDHAGAPANKGLPGTDGADACTDEIGLGGAQAYVACADGQFSTGGQGGDGGEQSATGGLSGLQPPAPNPMGFGEGGKAETAPWACTAGSGGAQGPHGMDGSAAVGAGSISEIGYTGVAGQDGTPGLPGQGGGGGGASFGKALVCGAAPHGGAGGGAGGAGGCGGKPGKGGQAGGSSIGMIVLESLVELQGVVIEAGDGGRGGRGGALQQGGLGALPGQGGLGFGSGPGGVKSGCAGGAGGNGGNGGNGGGGHGGHSIAVASFAKGSLSFDAASFLGVGQAGAGGKSGNPNAMSGESGTAQALGNEFAQ
jgi:hypothetical protein